MKLIVLTLCCLFIALSSVADAARFYRCVDSNGNALLTDNPPADATCEGKGSAPDLTPKQRQQIQAEQATRKIDRQTEAANARIDAAIEAIKNDPNMKAPGGGLKGGAWDKIVELENTRLRNQRSTPSGYQQDEMEDKMKRQQRDMEEKKRQQEAEIHRQEREIRDLKSQKEWADHKARWNIK